MIEIPPASANTARIIMIGKTVAVFAATVASGTGIHYSTAVFTILVMGSGITRGAVVVIHPYSVADMP
ncbi:MAG TPA: hypothetical protein DEB10_13010 [Ruminococcaceae bacterium]|jgi:hypothetical protein|nr:hypothetical protein [Oscillospiraceae bacterium]